MKKIFLFEPSIASNNVGDQIIVESIKKEMHHFLNENFFIELPTHTPISNRYMYFLGKPDMKFVCGSNIIVGKLNTIIHLKQWMLNPLTIHNLYNSVFIGVGAQQYNQKIGLYTKRVYHKLFAKNYLHSVRDSYTETMLKNIGITNIINTGCPTMWSLTSEHCKTIPTLKSNKVVFTLTDYKPNKQRDEFLISILKANYNKIYFWPQGYNDFNYFKTLAQIENISIIPPHLNDFDNLLSSKDIDYIGTRLHGGIRALQKGIRSLIIGVDNRAIELNKDFNIPVINQNEIENIETIICSKLITDIKLPYKNISAFLNQFSSL